MALYDVEEDLMLEGQCPCEFCGEPFPFDILIEHQTGCDPVLTSFATEDFSYTIPNEKNPIADIIDDIIAPQVEKVKIEIRDLNQNKPKIENVGIPLKSSSTNVTNLVQKPIKSTAPKIENVGIPLKSSSTNVTNLVQKPIKSTAVEGKNQASTDSKFNVINELKQDKKFKERTTEQYKDDLSSCTGERLMSFGSAAVDSTKECDNENQEHQNYSDNVEDIEDINNISDDESSETLEEFWKRAKDFLKRQRGKNI